MEHHALPLHCLEYVHSPLGLLALLASADQRATGDDIGHQTFLVHCLTKLGDPHRRIPILTGADQGAADHYYWHLAVSSDGSTSHVAVAWNRILQKRTLPLCLSRRR